MTAILSCDGRSWRPGKNDEIFSLAKDDAIEVDFKLVLRDSLARIPKGEWISISDLENLLGDNDFGVDVVAAGTEDIEEVVDDDLGPEFIFGDGKIPEKKEFIICCEGCEYETPEFVDVEGPGFSSCLTGEDAYNFQRNSDLVPQQKYLIVDDVDDSTDEKVEEFHVSYDPDEIMSKPIGMGRSVRSGIDMRRKDLKKQKGFSVFFKGKRIVYGYKRVPNEEGGSQAVSIPFEHAIDEYWKEIHGRQIRSQRRLIMSREFALG